MGIFCHINLCKSSDGVYRPGEYVSGIIKYALDEPMEVEKITTSLKGIGVIYLKVRHMSRNPALQQTTYRTYETYVDQDYVIQEKKVTLPVGSNEIKISFQLPGVLPSTVNVIKRFSNYYVTCRIKYYIRLKFERPGMFAFNKHFKKEITIVGSASPTLPREPVIYGETKKLIRLFSSKDSVINIKASITNSVLPLGGKIEINYEVENGSHVTVKNIETKLIETYKFKAKGHREVVNEKTLPDTESKTTSIKSGATQEMSFEINLPPDINSLDNSNIISRQYFVRIIVVLPIPHTNATLNIPVHIGTICEPSSPYGFEVLDPSMPYDDAPPSYWEAMGETKKEDDDEVEDDFFNEKGEKFLKDEKQRDL